MLRKRIYAMSATMAVAAALSTGTAIAEPSATGPTKDKKHCVYNVDTKVARCYATLAEAHAPGADGSPSARGTLTASGSAYLAFMYDANGASLTLTNTNGCSQKSAENIPGWWNDRMTSVDSYCYMTFYQNAWQGGAGWGVVPGPNYAPNWFYAVASSYKVL
ncbi:hypothetical protein [Yinghuangia seranimata]|uniref:hypothetical protein n=1 Tax=Yinghuangia seranimata TaxID=408067 RepID=UPI00248B4E3F|nr:hypothetical protein [Yinghuangia seranimata]MDI2130785.1 hypothetical protein [Yinghuangia seranimata]